MQYKPLNPVPNTSRLRLTLEDTVDGQFWFIRSRLATAFIARYRRPDFLKKAYHEVNC